MDGAEDVIGELSRDDVRQMAGAADEVVVLVGSDAQGKCANGFPEVLDYADGVVGGIGSGRYSADGFDEKISAGRAGAGLFRAGHGMTADEFASGLGDNRLEFLH